MVIGYGLHEHDFSTDILCDLLDLELPEMGSLNLQLPAGHCDNAVLGRLDAFADFLALTYIDFHGLFLHATTELCGLLTLVTG
jgi:hypothetical protein